MKNLIAILMAMLLIPVAFAQETTEDAAGLTPDSPLYFLDELGDGLKVAMASGELAKNEARLDIAEEKMAEYKLMEQKEKPKDAIKAMEGHNNRLREVEESQMTERQMEQIQLRLQRHIMVMEKVRAQVPESAQGSIEKALQRATSKMAKIQGQLPEDKVIPEEQLREQLQAKVRNSFAEQEMREVENRIDEETVGKVPEKSTLDKYGEVDQIENNHNDRWNNEQQSWIEKENGG